MKLSPLRAAWRSSFDLYRVDSADAAAMRAQQLASVVRLGPVLAAANAFNALVVLLALGHHGWGRALVWALLMGLPIAGMLSGWLKWRRARRTAARSAVSRRTFIRSAWHGALLGACWGMLPLLWFGVASEAERVLIACILAGMAGGVMFILVPLPASALSFISALTLASLVALVSQAQLAYIYTALLLLCYAITLSFGVLAGARKSNALLRAQREEARQRRFVSVLLQDFESHASEALWAIDAQGRLTHVSPRLAELLAGEASGLQQAPLSELLWRRSAQAAEQLQQALARGLPFQELRLQVGEQADARWWAIGGKPLFDAHGRAAGWRGVIADVSADVLAQRRLEHLAHHDGLTGLANRLKLSEGLQAHLAQPGGGALLIVDLDDFKAVNDSHGHSMGDALLKDAARRLQRCVRPSDLVARLGGDEFAILASAPCTAHEAMLLARRVVVALDEPEVIEARLFRVGASVGVALLGEHGVTVDEVTGHADMALYEAKARGRRCAVLYEAAFGERNRRRAQLEEGLRGVAERGELLLHWQPQVDSSTQRMVGAEALLRWRHPQLGQLGPQEFITAAEQSGHIVAMGNWVLNEACRAAAERLPGMQVSVNVSPVQLRDPHFARNVQAVIEAHGLEPTRLELEITESMLIEDADGAVKRLQALRDLGVRVALDDFGTGYASLAYLRRFPLDTLKIDRAFVSELLSRRDARLIVSTIVQLAEALGMRTVAEGVEAPAQLAMVQEAGCEQVQGFLVAPPGTLGDLLALRQQWPHAAPPGLLN